MSEFANNEQQWKLQDDLQAANKKLACFQSQVQVRNALFELLYRSYHQEHPNFE